MGPPAGGRAAADAVVAELARYVVLGDPQPVFTIGALGGDLAELYVTATPDWLLAAPGTRIAPRYDDENLVRWRAQHRATRRTAVVTLAALSEVVPAVRSWAVAVQERIAAALDDAATDDAVRQSDQLRRELAAVREAEPAAELREHLAATTLEEMALLGQHAHLAERVLDCGRCRDAVRAAWEQEQGHSRTAWDWAEIVASTELTPADARIGELRAASAMLAAGEADKACKMKLPEALRAEVAALARDLVGALPPAEAATAEALLTLAYELAGPATARSGARVRAGLRQRLVPLVEHWTVELEDVGTLEALDLSRALHRASNDCVGAGACSSRIGELLLRRGEEERARQELALGRIEFDDPDRLAEVQAELVAPPSPALDVDEVG